MFNILKPKRPKFSHEISMDTVVVTVDIPPRNKKRRVATSVSDTDAKLYMETENISFGDLLTGPGYTVSNGTSSPEFYSGVWVYKLRDLRVGKKPIPVRKSVKTSKTKSSKKTK